MSKVETVYWNALKYKYSPTDNYHGTCYYGALKLLFGKDFDYMYKEYFTSEIIRNQSTRLNVVNPLSKWANSSKEYRFADIDESLHDEEGVLWIADKDDSHIVYFKDGYYYDDYMSLKMLDKAQPLLIIVKVKNETK